MSKFHTLNIQMYFRMKKKRVEKNSDTLKKYYYNSKILISQENMYQVTKQETIQLYADLSLHTDQI